MKNIFWKNEFENKLIAEFFYLKHVRKLNCGRIYSLVKIKEHEMAKNQT